MLLFDLICINDMNIIQVNNFIVTKDEVKLLYNDGIIKDISYKKLEEYNILNLLAGEK